MENALPNIYAYIDFRKYLEDYYRARKEIEPGFTHQYMCYKLGQPGTRGYVRSVIKERVILGKSFVDRFIKMLELDTDQANYFRALVNYGQASSEEEKDFLFDQLVALNKTPATFIDKETYAYYKEWYHVTVRSLLDIIDFKKEYGLLSRMLNPKITALQAKESIALLTQLGLVKPNERGFLKPVDKVLITNATVKDPVIRRYQAENIRLGCSALYDKHDHLRKTVTYTMHISDKGYERVRARIEQFRTELRAIIHKDEDPPLRVYQMNLQLFTRSK